MSSLQWPVISPATHANQAGACKVPTYGNLVCKGNRISFRGIQLIDKVNMSYASHGRKNRAVKCTLYSPSNESNSKAEDFMEGDTAYVNAFVVETGEVRGSSDGLMVLMKDGKVLRCVHNNPQSRHQPDYTQNPLILLKIEEDVTGLLLPLLVLEKKPGMQLMDDATDDVQIARPSIYEVVMEMIEKMDYTVKLVRVADGAHGLYVSHLYLTKVNDKAEIISFDLQPSDAINIAIRCKAPIQVDRHLAYNDCLNIIEFAKPAAEGFSADDVLLFSAELDRPSDEQCVDAKEFNLLRNMLVAAGEERYCDAAQWRDKLNQLRSTWLWMFV